MQDREPSTFESIWSGNVVGGQRPEQPARLWNFLKSDRDEVLVVREPFGDRARAALLVTAALVASFGLGWAGGLNWPQFASELGLVEVAQKETPSPRISEARSSGRIEGRERQSAAGRIHTPLSEAFSSHAPCCPPVHARLRARPPRQMRALPPLRSHCGSRWWRRRKPGRATIPAGRVWILGTAPPFSKVLTEFGWPHAATLFPEWDAVAIHRALGQPLGHCHRLRSDRDAVTELPT